MKRGVLSGILVLAGAVLTACGATSAQQSLLPSSTTIAIPSPTRVIVSRPPEKPLGKTPKLLQILLKEAAIRPVAMVTAEDGWAYARERIWSISHAGAAWDLVWRHPAPILAFFAVSSRGAWAVSGAAAARVKVWHTTNGGRTWISTVVATHWQIAEAFLSVDSQGNGRILLTGFPAPLNARADLFPVAHGRVGTVPVYTSASSGMSNIVFPSAQVGMAVDQGAAWPPDINAPLFRTTNGGAVWSTVGVPNPPHVAQSTIPGGQQFFINPPLDFVSASTGYAAFTYPSSVIYRTADGGAAWSPINMPPVTRGYGISTTWLTGSTGWVLAASKGPCFR